MKKRIAALALALAPISALHAQNMPLAQFLTKADALEKKGALALFSKDIGVLKKEIQNSALAVRRDQIAARKAGRKPATCMPDKIKLDSDDLLAHFRAIPAAQRNVPVKAAFADMMRKRYPCR